MGLLASDDTDCFIGNVGSSVFGSMTLGQRDKKDLPLPKKSTYGNGQCSGPAVFSILTAENIVWLFPCLSMTEVHFTVNSRAYTHVSL